MRILELFIENERVDLFKDEAINITQTIKNVRDVSKVFAPFSQEFTLPASRTNNKIFKHYYQGNITGGFDARTRKSSVIKLNGIDFRKGYVKLNAVDLKDESPQSYKVVFFGSGIDFKDIVGDDKLQVLVGLNTHSFVYNSTNIKAKFELNGGNFDDNKVIVPLITIKNRLFYNSGSTTSQSSNVYYSAGSGAGVLFSQLKPAIRVAEIMSKIESHYGFTFGTAFFNMNTTYKGLFMWLHRQTGNAEQTAASTDVDGDTAPVRTTPITAWSAGSFNANAYMQSTSELNVGSFNPFAINSEFRLQIESSDGVPYSVLVYHNGELHYESGFRTSNLSRQFFRFNTYPNVTGIWTVAIQHRASKVITKCEWDVRTYEYYGTTGIGTVTKFNDSFTATVPFTLQNEFLFTITEQIPEMKVIDFITGIFQMFNLVAYKDKNDVIQVLPYDAAEGVSYSGLNATSSLYYGISGEEAKEYDITQYVDVSKSTVAPALPYNTINFSFEGNDTFLAKSFSEIFNKEFGALSYNEDTTERTISGGTLDIKLPFEKMMFERLPDINDSTGNTLSDHQWGWAVDIQQESTLTKPLIFCTKYLSSTISFRTDLSANTNVTSYNIPTNSEEIVTTTSDKTINFNEEFNEYDQTQDFSGTLFAEYYGNYISDIFDERSRLVKLTAYLPDKILIQIKLNDYIIYRNQNHKINSIKTNLLTNKSELELITTTDSAGEPNYITLEDDSSGVDFVLTENSEYVVTE